MLKKVSIFFMIIVLSFIFCFSNVYARAGGGTSGGSSGSSSSSSSTRGTRGHSSRRSNNPFGQLVNGIVFVIFSCSTIIIVKIRLTKAKTKTRKKFKKLKWDYDEVKKRIEDTYFVIQEAWSNGDMSSAKGYMMPDLLESFQIKLDWQDVANKKNIMHDIKLLEFYPVSLIDVPGDEKDIIWVYIKGKMVDYIVDMESGQVIEGSTTDKVFVEFWQFKKNEDSKWALNKILQENELDKVPLEE